MSVLAHSALAFPCGIRSTKPLLRLQRFGNFPWEKELVPEAQAQFKETGVRSGRLLGSGRTAWPRNRKAGIVLQFAPTEGAIQFAGTYEQLVQRLNLSFFFWFCLARAAYAPAPLRPGRILSPGGESSLLSLPVLFPDVGLHLCLQLQVLRILFSRSP
jgi:hypothetical protein